MHGGDVPGEHYFPRMGLVEDVSAEHLADLMDAVHNIPHLVQEWERCDVVFLRKSFLLVYQHKWSGRGGLALCDIFDGIVAEHGPDAEPFSLPGSAEKDSPRGGS